MLAVLSKPNKNLVAVEDLELLCNGRLETIVSNNSLCPPSEAIEDDEEDGFLLNLDMPGMCFLA
jgi:hypothetical protein